MRDGKIVHNDDLKIKGEGGQFPVHFAAKYGSKMTLNDLMNNMDNPYQVIFNYLTM